MGQNIPEGKMTSITSLRGQRPSVHRELHPNEGQQLVNQLERLLCREAIEQTDETNLITKPKSIIGAPAPVDLVDVRCGQRRLLPELSARVAGLCQRSIVRHLVTSTLSVYAEAINFTDRVKTQKTLIMRL